MQYGKWHLMRSLNFTHPLYRATVNLTEPDQVSFWAKHFNITPGQLKEAVDNTHSNRVNIIEHYLQERRYISVFNLQLF